MEIRTCEEYVLSELEKAQNRAAEAEDQLSELQRIIYTVQNSLELVKSEDGSLSIEVDEYVSMNKDIENFLVQLLGRGKYGVETDTAADAENNVEG